MHIVTFTSNCSCPDFEDLTEPAELSTEAAMQVLLADPSPSVTDDKLIQQIIQALPYKGHITLERMCLTQGRRQNPSIKGVFSVRTTQGFHGAVTIRVLA
jgi:hypothetical protein